MAILTTTPGPNGCTGGISKLWRLATGRRPPFEPCCNEHDLFYDEGGGSEDRRWADERMRDCISAAGYPALALLMWTAVRLLGGLFWGRS